MKIGFGRWLKATLYAIVVLILFCLPYYLFDGRLFLGGDDTRLHYIYPLEFLKNLSLYSWVNISSLPSYLPNFHLVPFLSALTITDYFINSKLIQLYFVFSLPYVIGFIYFQKFIKEIIGPEFEIGFIASLVYVFAPITVISQMSYFLFSVYLIGVIPLILYYYVSYIKRGNVRDVFKAVFLSILFSFAFFAIQWILALIVIFSISIFIYVLIYRDFKKYIKRTFIFGYFIISSQMFWLIPFFYSLFNKTGADLGSKVVSNDFINTFESTVNATATGNILYPLLTFYHRDIIVGYEWQASKVFLNYFDYLLPISIVYVLVIFLGFINFNKVLSLQKQKLFILFSILFLVALYFETVNIGFLKNIFIQLGNFPGFAIFRNFTDKFALAYIFIYSSFFAICLLVIKKTYKKYAIIFFVVLFAVIINVLPIKKIIVNPLWQTKNTYTTVNLPEEYILFLENAKLKIPTDSNVIAFPQNIASYAIVTEDNGLNAYVGTSPFKYLTGINDLSGSGSYPQNIRKIIEESIINRDYVMLNNIFAQLNIGYLMVTENVSKDALDSYLYDKDYLRYQDQKLINSLKGEIVLRSKNGNYIIYKLKNDEKVLTSDSRLNYMKNNQIDYDLTLFKIKGDEYLNFEETYHSGWKLYIEPLNAENSISRNTFPFLGGKDLGSRHLPLDQYGNKWVFNSENIKKSFSDDYYNLNSDGSIDIRLKLNFYPQIYFYLGIIITFLMLIFGGILLFLRSKNEKK